MKQQTSKHKTWIDAKGNAIPFNRTTGQERLQERSAHKLASEALRVEALLKDLKELVLRVHAEVLAGFDRAKGTDIKASKGNKVWYNFDRSIMVEADVQDRIEFDGLLITAAREKLHSYLTSKLSSDDEFLVEMVTKAFETTNGKLDSKRVMHLVSYKSKVKATLFQEAIALIEQSIQRTNSKTYFRIALRQEDGSYRNLNLNIAQL